jgi:PAS domain S-box-containing protein
MDTLPDVQVEPAMTPEDLARALARARFDLALVGLHTTWQNGVAVLEAVNARHPSCPVIAWADTWQGDTVQQAVEVGLDGYIVQSGSHFPGLPIAIRLALDRVRERQAMEEVQLRYRSLFEGVPVGLYRTLPSGRIVDANPFLVHMLGYPDKASLLAINAADLYLNPEDRSRWMFALQRATSVRNFQTQFRRHDGCVIWVNNNARAVRDHLGHVLHYEGILEDITESRRAEDALRESEKRFRTLVEQSPISVQIMTPEGGTRLVNRAWEDLWGVSLEALRDYNMLEDNQLRRLGILTYIEEGFSGRATSIPPVEYDASDTLGTGRKRWVQAHIYPVKDERGRIHDVILMHQDITERKRTEEELRESEERFRTLVEQSPISIQIMTPDGWTEQINEAYMQLWGVTLEDLREYNMLQDEQAKALGIMPYIERAFAGHAVSIPSAEYDAWETMRKWKTVRKGKKRWFQARMYPVKDQHGNMLHVIMMHEDITQQKRAEEELRRRAEHLEALNAENAQLLEAVTQQKEELQRLSSQVIHAHEAERQRISRGLHDELGQMLTAMRINLAALEKELPPNLEPSTRVRITETSALVDETLDQVRELSLDLRPQMLDDLGLVSTLRWYVNRYAARTGIDVCFEAVNLEERLATDIETTLYRVVQEALTNIARHAEADRVHLHLERSNTAVSARIKDDGQGFDVHAGPALPRKKEGTGLIGIRERVTALGGHLHLESRPQWGTCLLIEIPVRTTTPPTGTETNALPAHRLGNG